MVLTKERMFLNVLKKGKFSITIFSIFFLSLTRVCFSLNKNNFNVGDSVINEEKIIKDDLKNISLKQSSNALVINKNENIKLIKNKGIIKGNLEVTRNNVYFEKNENPNLRFLDSFQFFPMDALESGNGIYNDNISIENRGIITGSSTLINKNIDIPINNASTIGFIYSQLSGNGIYGGKEILNTGILAGNSTIFSSQIISEDTPVVIQSSIYSRISGNGIYADNIPSEKNTSFLKNNNGIIRGQSIIQGGSKDKNTSADIHSKQSGNGIYINNFQDSFSKNIILDKNSGVIKGFSSLKGEIIDVSYSLTGYSSASTYSLLSGNGISVGQDTTSTPKNTIPDNENASIISGDVTLLKNSGIISGKIFVQGGEITNLSGNSESYNNYSYARSISSGNGISTNNLYLDLNTGIISGEAIVNSGKINISSPDYFDLSSDLYSETSGNGIQGNNDINLTLNQGIISGSILTKNFNISEESILLVQSGNGINRGHLIKNEGTISGYAIGNNNFESGNGIVFSLNGGTITNKGIIKGSNHSITTSEIGGDSERGKCNNYGLLAGKNIFWGNIEKNNFGIYVTGNGIIEKVEIAPSGAIIDNKTVINAESHNDYKNINDAYFKIKDFLSYDNNIINGVGLESGTLTLTDNSTLEVSNSIVNSYKTSVTLNEESNLVANNTIFNGGGLQNNDSVIESTGNNVKINLKNSSVVNGNISLNGNYSELNISNQTQINGDIISEGANNNLTLGNEFFLPSDSLVVYKKIRGFDSIATKGSVFLSSDASIDKGIITIKKDSNLIIALDGTFRDKNNYVTGHALYNHTGQIILESQNEYTGLTSNLDDNAQVIFKASGLGEGTIIAMNGTDVSSINDYYLGTTSIVHTVRKLNDADGNLIISIKNFDEIFINKPPKEDEVDFNAPPDNNTDIPSEIIPNDKDKNKEKPSEVISDGKNNPKTEIEYKNKVENIYNEIKDSKQISSFFPTTDDKSDSKLELICLLDQIYANNPYAFVGESSKEAIDLFRVSHQYTPIPEQGDYTVSGSAISSYSNYKDVTIGNTIEDTNFNNSYGRSSKIFGGLGDIEYGLGQKSSIGVLIGGANQKVNMSHNSDLDGDILFLGAYHRKELRKYTFETGIGYQYASYDVTRNISNKYQKIENNGDVDTNSIVLYEDIRYLLNESNGWKVEPKVSFTAVRVNQNSAKEKKSDLSINVDSQSYNYFDTEAGIEITKEAILESGKLRTKGSLSYINSQGPSEEKISSNFSQGGEKFDILGPELSTNNGKVGLEVTYEKPSGLEYFAGVDYTVGEGKKNTTVGKIGINYKF